jgi:WD40 repeat protein
MSGSEVAFTVCVHPPAVCSVLGGHMGWINDVAVTNNGRRAVTASGDGTARLWDTRRCDSC